MRRTGPQGASLPPANRSQAPHPGTRSSTPASVWLPCAEASLMKEGTGGRVPSPGRTVGGASSAMTFRSRSHRTAGTAWPSPSQAYAVLRRRPDIGGRSGSTRRQSGPKAAARSSRPRHEAPHRHGGRRRRLAEPRTAPSPVSFRRASGTETVAIRGEPTRRVDPATRGPSARRPPSGLRTRAKTLPMPRGPTISTTGGGIRKASAVKESGDARTRGDRAGRGGIKRPRRTR